MKVALVHDHLTQAGGAERVLEALQSIWPDAPTHTLLYDKHALGSIFGHRDIRTSFLQNMPFSLKHPRWYLPLMPTATEGYDLAGFDVVLSSSSAFSKGVVSPTDAIHICYCHTPTRYLWSDTHSYVNELSVPGAVKRLLPPLLTTLRMWDRLAADRVDFFLANSQTVKRRIKKYYKRDCEVIYPPVEVDEFSISNKKKTYFLIGGRLVAYKRYDIVIEAFNRTGLPLKVFGSGPVEKKLRGMAKQNIEFMGRVSNRERARLFRDAIAFVHPQEEDFGITPVESMAAGRPVIAYRRGGAIETVLDGKTGVLFDRQTWEEVADTVLNFNASMFDPAAIRKHAETFSLKRYHKEMHEFVTRTFERHRRLTIGAL